MEGKAGLVTGAASGIGGACAIRFAQGNAAMIMTGFWNIASLKDAPQVRWGISPLFRNTKQATISFQSGLAITKSSKRPELAGMGTTYQANSQQLYVDLDRARAETLGVRVGDVFQALQGLFGSQVVGQFSQFSRVWFVIRFSNRI